MSEREINDIRHLVGTTPRAQALGEGLRRTREASGVSIRTLAKRIGKSHTTVARWETGERPPKPVDVATILGILDAEHAVREQLLELAGDMEGQHWVATSLPDVHRQVATMLEMERDAARIVHFSQLLLPGLLQTRDYARAIIGAGGVPPTEIETRLAIRAGRREAITRKFPARLLALIDQTALQRDIGGPEVMRDQLRMLLEFAAMPNVEIRLVPTKAGWHPGLETAFLLVEFRNRTPVVQIENRRSAQLVHQPADVDLYLQAAAWIERVSLSTERSAEIITAIIEDREPPV